jgi:3-hydroxyisobutyrate dehydrogenase
MSDGKLDVTKEHLRVAVIGLGAMGLPMLERLMTRLDVTAFDLVEERVSKAGLVGAKVAPSVEAAVAGAAVVLLAVRTLSQVEATLFGPEGAGASLDADAIVILTSTIGTPGARHIGERLAARGVRLIDMPVSGGPVRARSGELLAFVGADEETIATARPVIDLLASTVTVVGPHPGDGQALKTVNQLLCGVHIAAAVEALALAKGLGLDPQAAFDVLGAGAAASFMLTNRGPRIIEAIRGMRPEVLSRIDIFVKDMSIVTDAGHRAGVALPVAAAAEQLYVLAQAAGLGPDDDSVVVTLLSEELILDRSEL